MASGVVKGGCQSLTDPVHSVDCGAGFVVVGDVVGVEGVCDADRGGVFIFSKGDKKVVWVWEDGRGVDRRER